MNDKLTPLDQATSARLARLSTMPVETASLEARLRAQLPFPARARPRILRWKGLAALAATLTVAAAILVVLLTSSSGPVMASTADMVRFHEDLVSGKTPVVKVDSIDQAAKALSDQWDGRLSLPNVPSDHVMACCMKSVNNKRVACVLLSSNGTPVTLVVADAREVKAPAAGSQSSGWYVHRANNLNMLMANREGRMICLIADLPREELISLASHLRF